MEFTFTLTEQEANAVLTAIQELPAKVANPLTQKLVEQAKAQSEPPAEAAKAEVVED